MDTVDQSGSGIVSKTVDSVYFKADQLDTITQNQGGVEVSTSNYNFDDADRLEYIHRTWTREMTCIMAPRADARGYDLSSLRGRRTMRTTLSSYIGPSFTEVSGDWFAIPSEMKRDGTSLLATSRLSVV